MIGTIEIILLIGSILVSVFADIYIRSTYAKTREMKTTRGLTGEETARMILDKNDLKKVKIKEVAGDLSDHYNPQDKTVNLSTYIHSKNSIASIAVASHECGHAIQDKDGYLFLRIRRSLFPLVNLATKLGYVAIIIALIAQSLTLFRVGIYAEMIILFFQVITLPVEFDASRRALKKVEEYGIVTKDELRDCKRMLRSAALTYVAAVTSTLLEILRLILIFRSND